MNALSAIVVDDEHKSREVLKTLLEKFCSEVTVIAEAPGISKAEELIRIKKPDLIFLDIEMPDGEGFKLLEKFPDPFFSVIFVTSYDHYALRAIKFSALDYLLKPVIIADLKIAVEKAIRSKQQLLKSAEQFKILSSNLLDASSPKKLFLNNKTKTNFVWVKDIFYLQADVNYTVIHTSGDQKHIVAKSLKDYDELLCIPEIGFLRIHKSTIVNPAFVSGITGKENSSILLSTGTLLEISRRRKNEILEIIFEILKKRNS